MGCPIKKIDPLNFLSAGITDKVIVGALVGTTVGETVGRTVGSTEGLKDGERVGFIVGDLLGFFVVVGAEENDGAGTGVGALLARVGPLVGWEVEGWEVGCWEG